MQKALRISSRIALQRKKQTGGFRGLSTVTVGGTGGSLWANFVTAPNTPAGFTLKTAFDAVSNPTGATTMLEQWKAGSAEPPHSHPGDDATIVIEGTMRIQFFTKQTGDKLIPDGMPLILRAGQTGYIAANRIHDASYLTDCKLVYVHQGGFGFDGH